MENSDMRTGDYYFLPVDQGEQLPLYVEMLGTDYCSPQYRVIRPISDVAFIAFVCSGEGHAHLDEDHAEVKKGDILLLPIHRAQDFYPSLNDPWVYIWFNVKGPLVSELLYLYGLANRFVIRGTEMKHSLQPLFNSALLLATDKKTDVQLLHQSITLIVIRIIMEISTMIKHQERKIILSEAVAKIKNYIDLHVEDSINLEQLSKMVTLTPRHLIRLFKRDVGVTPYNYAIIKKSISQKVSCSLHHWQ
jgi:AraC family transcriptional regulator of arabinose operon